MPRPFLLAQLSDTHIGARWGDVDPAAGLAAALECVRTLEPVPNAVLLSGDLVESGADAEYELLKTLLGSCPAPLFVLPGNHDDRAALRRHFALPGEGAAPIQYAAELGPLRLVVLDTTRPGEAAGELDASRLGWLDAELSAAREIPTIVAMHHPPIPSGLPEMDAIGVPPGERRALADVVRRHPQARRLVAGHVHRTIVGSVGGCPAIVAPSTYVQARIQFESQHVTLVREPPGIAVHALLDGELVSHVQPIG
jgi:3',5'-cyclic AMP phosphodiesterase CpdA